MKSFRPKDGGDAPPGGGRNPSRDFRGERRSNATHGSITDPDARLYRKGPGMEARLGFVGHVLMENRSGLVVDAELTRASGHAERLAGLAMLDRLPSAGPATLGADRGFDAGDFVMELRERQVTPHIAQNTSGRRSAIDRRTTRHEGYAQSQRARKRIEEAFGWIKTIAGQVRTRLRGLDRVRWTFMLAAAAYNLIRLPKLIGATPRCAQRSAEAASACPAPAKTRAISRHLIPARRSRPRNPRRRPSAPAAPFFNDLLIL